MVLERSKTALFNELMSDPKSLSQRFFERMGYHATGSGLLADQALFDVSRIVINLAEPEFFQWRVTQNLDETIDHLKSTNIEVMKVTPGVGELMIADDPAAMMKHGYAGVGPLTGVSWAEANTAWLPLSPTFAIALNDTPKWGMIDARGVHLLNCVQLSVARDRVFYRPSSGLRGIATRAMKARAARPAGLGPSLIDPNL